SAGDVAAQTSDPWGQTSNTATVTLTNAPTISFTATIVGGTWVDLSGQVGGTGNPMTAAITFGGILVGSVAPNADGAYRLLVQAATLGTITARVTDADGQQSDTVAATIGSNAPTLTLTYDYGCNGSVLLSGTVTDEDRG